MRHWTNSKQKWPPVIIASCGVSVMIVLRKINSFTTWLHCNIEKVPALTIKMHFKFARFQQPFMMMSLVCKSAAKSLKTSEVCKKKMSNFQANTVSAASLAPFSFILIYAVKYWAILGTTLCVSMISRKTMPAIYCANTTVKPLV